MAFGLPFSLKVNEVFLQQDGETLVHEGLILFVPIEHYVVVGGIIIAAIAACLPNRHGRKRMKQAD
jgi:hypothetical protein